MVSWPWLVYFASVATLFGWAATALVIIPPIALILGDMIGAAGIQVAMSSGCYRLFLFVGVGTAAGILESRIDPRPQPAFAVWTYVAYIVVFYILAPGRRLASGTSSGIDVFAVSLRFLRAALALAAVGWLALAVVAPNGAYAPYVLSAGACILPLLVGTSRLQAARADAQSILADYCGGDIVPILPRLASEPPTGQSGAAINSPTNILAAWAGAPLWAKCATAVCWLGAMAACFLMLLPDADLAPIGLGSRRWILSDVWTGGLAGCAVLTICVYTMHRIRTKTSKLRRDK